MAEWAYLLASWTLAGCVIVLAVSVSILILVFADDVMVTDGDPKVEGESQWSL